MKQKLERLLSTSTETEGFHLGFTFLRVLFGSFMAFSHGLGKVPPSEKFIEGVANLGFPSPEFFAWCAGLSEFAGGLFLALGFCTRPSAAFVAFTMGVAAFVRHSADPFSQKELALVYFIFSIALMFMGGGKYSIDALLLSRKKT